MLEHVNFSSILVELDFVHELIDEINSASVIGINILFRRGTRHISRIKTRPRVAHHNHESVLIIAYKAAFHRLRRVAFASMHNRVGESFGES